jgi:hypothetical protein
MYIMRYLKATNHKKEAGQGQTNNERVTRRRGTTTVMGGTFMRARARDKIPALSKLIDLIKKHK